MGFFDKVGDVISDIGRTGQDVLDTIDILDVQGKKAKEAANRVGEILEASAREGIALNEAQLLEIENLTKQ